MKSSSCSPYVTFLIPQRPLYDSTKKTCEIVHLYDGLALWYYFLVLGTIIIENFSLLDKCIIQTLRICFGPTVGQDFPNCQRRRRKQSCYYNNTLPEAISEATRPVAVVDGISRESSAWLQPRWWPAVLTAEIESHTTISQNFPDCLGLNHAKRAAASI